MTPFPGPTPRDVLHSPAPAIPFWRRAAEAGVVFGMLFGFWVVLSGRFTPLTLALGVLSAALVTALNAERPLWVGGPERSYGMPLASLSLGRLAVFPFQLLGAIIKANLQVAALVLHPRLPIHPVFIQLRTGLTRPLSQVVLANLITMTPGTIAVDLQDGKYLVHSLEPRLSADLLSGALPATVAQLLGERPEQAPQVLGVVDSIQDLVP